MRCTQVGRVDGKVCGRPLVGTQHWCWVHPEAEADFGPYAGEDQRDRRQMLRKDRQADPLAEADDYATQPALFELPQQRGLVVQAFSDGEMASWVQANSR